LRTQGIDPEQTRRRNSRRGDVPRTYSAKLNLDIIGNSSVFLAIFSLVSEYAEASSNDQFGEDVKRRAVWAVRLVPDRQITSTKKLFSWSTLHVSPHV